MAKPYTIKTNPNRNIPELNQVWFDVLHAMRDQPATEVVKRMPKRKAERIAPSTIRNLRNGKTAYPTLRTAFIIAKAMGNHLSFADEVENWDFQPKSIKVKIERPTAKSVLKRLNVA